MGDVDVAAAVEGTSEKSGPPVVAKAERKMVWGTPNPLSKLVFAYVSPLIGIGQIRRLEPEDLCHLPQIKRRGSKVQWRLTIGCSAVYGCAKS